MDGLRSTNTVLLLCNNTGVSSLRNTMIDLSYITHMGHRNMNTNFIIHNFEFIIDQTPIIIGVI